MVAPATERPGRTVKGIAWKLLKWAFYLVLALFFLSSLTFGDEWLADVPLKLVFGWIGFIATNAASVEVNVELLVQGIVCTIALAVGGHYFCNWLYREMGTSSARAWRWQWTASGLAIVLLMFVASIATIGCFHQVAWLVNSKKPLLLNSLDWSSKNLATGIESQVRNAYTLALGTYATKGRLPRKDDIDQDMKKSWISRSRSLVLDIAVRENGEMVIAFGKIPDRDDDGAYMLNGEEVTLTFAVDSATQTLTFSCRSTLPPKYAPKICRQ